MDQLLEELLEDTQYSCGFTTEADWDIDNSDETKLSIVGQPGPGADVEIYWEMWEEPDIGYIFTLPGLEEKDIHMSGIVHIPKPQGCEKCDCEPEWIHINRLLTNVSATKIIIKERR